MKSLVFAERFFYLKFSERIILTFLLLLMIFIMRLTVKGTINYVGVNENVGLTLKSLN